MLKYIYVLLFCVLGSFALFSSESAQADTTKKSSVIDIDANFKGNILTKGIHRGNFYYPSFALQSQRFLNNNTNKDIYRNVLLRIATDLMNADIKTYNTLNKAKISIEKDEARKPKRQRIKHLHHMVFLEDLLDSPQANQIAKTILQTNYDLRFFADIVDIENDPKVKNHIYLSFYDPTRIGDSDPKFYLARNIKKVEALVKLLVRNLPDEITFNGRFQNISVDPFDLKLKLESPDSFLEKWEWRKGGSSNKLDPYTKDRQIYDISSFRERPYFFNVKNDVLYSYPQGAKVIADYFDNYGEGSERRIGSDILENMRTLNDLLGDRPSEFVVTERDIDVTKANIPVDILETISKHLGSADDLPFMVQARLIGIDSVNGNESISIELELESLVLFGKKDGKIVTELSPDFFPYYMDKKPKPHVRNLEESIDKEFSFKPTAEERLAAQSTMTKPAEETVEAKTENTESEVSEPKKVENEEKPGPVDGYYYFVDRSRIKSVFELDGKSLCTPKEWERSSYMIEKNIKLAIWSYDSFEDGLEKFKFGMCSVIVLSADLADKAEELLKDYDLLIRELPPMPDEEIEKRRAKLFKGCESHFIQKAFYRCDCVADEYAQRIRDGVNVPKDTSIYINYVLGKGETQCANKEAIINDFEEFCHSTSLDETGEDRDTLCLCLAKRVAVIFEENPRLSLDWMGKIKVDTISSDKEIKQCKQ